MAEFTTILCLRHQATDDQEAIDQRFKLLAEAERLGFDAVGANTTDDPTDAAMRMVMGFDSQEQGGEDG